MKKQILTAILIFLGLSIVAQPINISGKIYLSEDGSALPGASVMITGTNTGTVSNLDGEYQIEVSGTEAVLEYSFIGCKTQKIVVGNQTVINVYLASADNLVNEIMVTALGIKKEKKALGYSVQEVKGEALETVRDVSVINQLAGKVAGLSVTATTGGPGSSSRIVLRGNSSLAGNNQALIVVDGVPVENQTNNTTNQWGGYDYGNGISDVNPDDIESISVLKGASASALYGSKAANGVIIITTKKGIAQKGIGISVNSSTSFESAYILNEFQNEYGAGRNGKFEGSWEIVNNIPVYNTASAAAYGSWGPKMEGQTIIDWDGVEKKFVPQPDNYKDYFQTGITSTNTIALEGGNEKATYRFSFSNLYTEDIVPKTTLDRKNFNLSITAKPVKNLIITGNANYTMQKAENRLGLSNWFSAPRNICMMPRHISDESLKNNMENEKGEEQVWYTNWGWMSNPYWTHTKDLNDDRRDRVIGNISLSWLITPDLTFMVRSATDFNMHRLNSRQAYNSFYNSRGSYNNNWRHSFQMNTDFLFSYNKNLNTNFDLSLSAGGSTLQNNYETTDLSTKDGLSIADFYNINYSNSTPTSNYYYWKKKNNALYATGQIAYKSVLFIDFTARNDWSSTLPADNNSYFYPSVSLSWVFSDMFNIQNILPYGKLRMSWAQVGNDTEPYRLTQTYGVPSELKSFNSAPMMRIVQSIPLKNLKPEKTTNYELGTDLRFLNNRLGIDFTYYYATTVDQILAADITPSAGAAQAIINTGEVLNKGYELQLNISPIKNQTFEWNLVFNYAKNNSEVVELTAGLDKLLLLEHWRLSIEARPGNSYGDIVGYGIQRDANGIKLVDAQGFYLRTENPIILGNNQADWLGGISSSMNYKNFSLAFSVDIRIGGEMFAGSNMYGYGYSGNYEETLAGREEWYASEATRETAGISPENWTATGGFRAEGVFIDGSQNDIYVNPENYWAQFSAWTHEIHEPFIYDASFVKLRELMFSYKIPKRILEKIAVNDVTFSLIGKNLWLIYSKVPNIDPESAYTNGNGQGYEIYSYPIRRSIGFNLNFKF